MELFPQPKKCWKMVKPISRGSNAQPLERTLIYIPIIHTLADMGNLSESVRRATLRKVGLQNWKRKVYLTNRMWSEIENAIDGLDLNYEKVRLYQDGLPVCGREAEIVEELAETGSRNHKLLLKLMERGATIMGTESSELLVEEYELIKQMMGGNDTLETEKNEASQKALSDLLLRKRDQYIADRINNTLPISETGILFLGMLHSLADLVDKNIQIIYPINRPSKHRGK